MRPFLHSAFGPHRRGVLIGVAALCLVLIFFGSLLFGPALASIWERLVLALGIVVLWLVFEALRHWRHKRANARMLEAIRKDGSAVPDVADENERASIRDQLDEIFKILTTEEIGHGLKRDFLRDMPYFLLVGPHGSGKSSLIKSADLRSPLEGRLGNRDIRMDVRGEQTQWWFTDEGLLIGAAPKTMDERVADGAGSAAWRGLLSYLKEHRPRRPVDGIMVVMSLDALLDPKGLALARYARSRAQEAVRIFASSMPFYLVVNKCDLLPGFTEYFSDLDEKERSQAFGATLPLEAPARGGGDVIATLKRELASSVEAVARRLPFRLASERNAERRAAIAGFPEQLAVAVETAAGFAAELMRAGRSSREIWLRGVFFTAAATEEGAREAPLDVWDERFAAPLGLAPVRANGRGSSAARPRFVAGVFNDFLFPEAGIGGRDPRLERRMALLHSGGYLACAVLLIASLVFWLGMFHRHQVRLASFRHGAAAESTLDGNLPPSPSLGAVLPLLDQARRLSAQPTETFVERVLGFAPLDIIAAEQAAIRSYHRLLAKRYYPLFLGELEKELSRAVAAGNDPSRIQSLLEVYLMLRDSPHYQRAVVSAWGERFISATFAFQPEAKADALAHWRSLLDLMPLPVALNDPLIAEARSLLQVHPTAEGIYSRLKAESESSNAAMPLDVVHALGTSGSELLMLRSQAGLSVVVPALYTREGFYRIFLKQAPILVHDAIAGDWIMGGTGTHVPGEATALLQEVTNDYVRDYVKRWQLVLNQIILRALPDLSSLLAGLQVLAGPQSPLIGLVQLVKNQTDLPVPPTTTPLAALANAAAGKGKTAKLDAAGTLVAAAKNVAQAEPANPLGTNGWPGDAIRAPFLPLTSLVGASSNQQGSALAVQNAVVAAYGVVSGIAAAQSPADAAAKAAAEVISGQGGDPLIQLRVQAATLPHPVDDIFRALYQNTWQVLLALTRDHVQADWTRSVAPACAQAIQGRFPFGSIEQPGTSGVALQDFAGFFGPRGTLDQFVANDLAPFTAPAPGGGLGLASQDGLTLDLPNDALAQINLGRRIQRLFFNATGNLALAFSLTPEYLDPRVLSATLVIDHGSLVYQHQPPRATSFTWPASGAGSASLTLTLVGGQTLQRRFTGPWALFRLFDSATTTVDGDPSRMTLAFSIRGYRASFVLAADSVLNPFSSRDFAEFRCVPRL